MRRGRKPHADILTPREWEVLALVSDGLTNEQIGERLGISMAGARYHVSEIISKLGVANRREAGIWWEAQRSEPAPRRRLPAIFPALPMLPRLPDARWFGRWAARLTVAGSFATVVIISAALLISRDRSEPAEQAVATVEPTPAEHIAVDFSQPTLGPRYVTEWALPEFTHQGRSVGANAGGIENVLPDLIAATLAGDAAGVREAGLPFGIATLRPAPQDPDAPTCGGGYGMCFWTVPLAPATGGNEYWAVVTGGWAYVPIDSPLAADEARMDGAASAFQHFVAVYERRPDGTWSWELARAELDDPRGECCDLTGASWNGGGRPFYAASEVLADPVLSDFSATLDDGIATVDWAERDAGITAITAPPGGGGATSWLAVRGAAVMASFASVFYLLEFDTETETLAVVESNLHRRWGGDLRDLDGDGVPEVMINLSDAYVFSGASGTEETFVRLLRWRDSRLVEVLLETPDGLPGDVTADVDRALALANAGLWTDAAALLVETADQNAQVEELRWLARRVQLIALGRLIQAERESADGGLRAPFLMMAGAYEAVVDMMREYPAEELFGPSWVAHEFANLSGPQGRLGLDYTARALEVAPDRPAIHAVRALVISLASPQDVSAAEASVAEAARLAPGDEFYAAALERLRSLGAE